jgi:hypothetical protein
MDREFSGVDCNPPYVSLAPIFFVSCACFIGISLDRLPSLKAFSRDTGTPSLLCFYRGIGQNDGRHSHSHISDKIPPSLT